MKSIFLAPIFAALFLSTAQADIYADAKTILSSGKNTIRRWEYPPIVAVVHNGNFDFDVLNTLIERISDTTAMPISKQKPRVLLLEDDKTDLTNNTRFRLVNRQGPKPKDVIAKLSFNTHPTLIADIFVFHLSRRDLAFFTTYTEASNRLSRGLLEGISPCFFDMRSKNDRVQQVTIFMDSDITAGRLKSCIYEEFMQAMGFLNDAEGTPHFTFDNKAIDKDQHNDFLLLRALYHPDVSAGDHPDTAVELFKKDHALR